MSWPRPAAPMTRLKGRVRKKKKENHSELTMPTASQQHTQYVPLEYFPVLLSHDLSIAIFNSTFNGPALVGISLARQLPVFWRLYLALLFYVYALTFPAEVKYIWRHKYQHSVILYICARYALVANVLYLLGIAKKLSTKVCLLYAYMDPWPDPIHT